MKRSRNELKLEIETTEEWVEQRQAMGDDLDAFIALTKSMWMSRSWTQTIVNESISRRSSSTHRLSLAASADKEGGDHL